MAVIQISKIQQRRGQKNITGSIPQLSAAEFAWAIDSQELFIGNGSITEGAPFVGNTKILTEHDNILELASGYRFSETDPSITQSKRRTIQSKLDEYVSVLDFGAVPDGSTDSTEAFHIAFEELFSNTDDKYKKILYIPNGTYLFLNDLKIPSNVVIEGENLQETVLEIGVNNIILVSENGTEPGGFSSTDYPHDIYITALTINHNSGETIISGSKNCRFERVKWTSDYVLGDTVFVSENANAVYNIPIVSEGGNIVVSGSGVSSSKTRNFSSTYIATLGALVSDLNADGTFNLSYVASISGTSLKITSLTSSALTSTIESDFIVSSLPNNDPGSISATITPVLAEFSDGSENVNASVYWDNLDFGTRTTGITFNRCLFISTQLAIECQQTSAFGTTISFIESYFYNNDTGIYIGGVQGQTNAWRIYDSIFEQIARYAINSTNGQSTHVNRSTFLRCGNGTGTPGSPLYPIITFGESIKNIIVDCSFDRLASAGVVSGSSATDPGIPEVHNASNVTIVDRVNKDIVPFDNFLPLAVFSANHRFIIIDYILKLGSAPGGSYARTGKITISMGNDLSGQEEVSDVSFTDTYSYSSSDPSAPGGVLMTNFQFDVSLISLNDTDDSTLGSNADTILLAYSNPLPAANGTISFTVNYGV